MAKDTMSGFNFGTSSSSSAPSNNATTTAPPSGGLFREAPGGIPSFSFGGLGGTSGNTTTASNSGRPVFGQEPAGEAEKPAGGLFGGASSSANASTTPTSGGNFFGGASTTPSAGGPFGAAASDKSAASTSAAPSTGKLFGAAGASSKPIVFGGAAPVSGSSVFDAQTGASQPQNATTTAAPSTGLFANTGSSFLGGKNTGTASTTAAESATPATAAATPAKPLLSLPSTTPAGAPPTDTSTPASAIGTSAAAAKPATSGASFSTTPSSLFGGGKAGAGSSAGSEFGNKPAAASGEPALFGGANQSSTAATSTPKPAPLLFGGGAATSTASQPAATTAPSSSAAPAASAPAAGGLLGAKPTADTANKDGSRSREEPGPATQSGAPGALGASTTGPTSQMARLKNKTMEDIVTRWASDLTKYQKEFKEQAAVVSGWDRSLVENGEKIQKLYLDTFEAERASHEIERQLAAVESQQEELEAWLNRYESEAQDMFAKQIGPGEQLAGPDQERERTYKLAEKLTQHLDEKSRDLSKMVKEINDISGTLSKGAKTEDPLSQIVRVLNSHLTQLQWIDVNASALQAKVAAAQQSSNSLSSHYAGAESDAAEGFYRSYHGRR